MTPTNSTSSSRSKHPLRGYLFIAGATLCWAVSANLGRAVFTGKLLASGGRALPPIDPLILAQSRTTISFLVLFPILWITRGTRGIAMARGDLLRALIVGVLGVASSNYFYYLAIQKTNVATAIILQYTAPILVLLYMVARRLQKPTLQRVASVLIALLGIGMVVGIFSRGGFSVDRGGLLAAETAAMGFAFYNVAGSKLLDHIDRWKVVVYCFLGAALFWIVVNPPWKIYALHYSATQWGFLAVFAVFSILLPFSIYFAGLQRLDPTRAIVTSCLEPVFSIVIAVSTLGETVAAKQVIGIALVLFSTILVQLPGRAREPQVVVEPME